jgi:hypothetical protein
LPWPTRRTGRPNDRHIPVRKRSEIDEKAFAALLKQAVK